MLESNAERIYLSGALLTNLPSLLSLPKSVFYVPNKEKTSRLFKLGFFFCSLAIIGYLGYQPFDEKKTAPFDERKQVVRMHLATRIERWCTVNGK